MGILKNLMVFMNKKNFLKVIHKNYQHKNLKILYMIFILINMLLVMNLYNLHQ